MAGINVSAKPPLFTGNDCLDRLPSDLVSDCGRCRGLCCVALYCFKAEGFPADKPAGTPCTHLRTDYRCAIHDRLFANKYKGCLAFDCLGAGQRFTRWMDGPNRLAAGNLPRLMEQHWVLWCLWQVTELRPCGPIADNAQALARRIWETAEEGGAVGAPMDPLYETARQIFDRAFSLIREKAGQRPERPKRDCAGRDLRREDLSGWDFRGAWLMGADLRNALAYGANFMGADLRDTRLEDADLSSSVFLTPAQIQAARGNRNTRLPPFLSRPSHWDRP